MQAVQVKMARAALGLSIEEIAAQAGVSPRAVEELEAGGVGQADATQGLGLFLAANGIELIDGDGVRAKPRQTADYLPVEELTTQNDGGQG